MARAVLKTLCIVEDYCRDPLPWPGPFQGFSALMDGGGLARATGRAGQGRAGQGRAGAGRAGAAGQGQGAGGRGQGGRGQGAGAGGGAGAGAGAGAALFRVLGFRSPKP